MRYPLFMSAVTLLLAFNGFAAEPPPKNGSKPPELPGKTIAKKVWVQAMHDNLPARLCDPDEYFMKCYKSTASECLALSTMIVDGCLKSASINLPDNVDPDVGEKWGKMVARCSFELYSKHMAEQRRDLPECQSKPASDKSDKLSSDKKSEVKKAVPKTTPAAPKGP